MFEKWKFCVLSSNVDVRNAGKSEANIVGEASVPKCPLSKRKWNWKEEGGKNAKWGKSIEGEGGIELLEEDLCVCVRALSALPALS